MLFKHKIWAIAVVSIGVLVLLNEVNLSYLKGEFPYKEGLITTADEPSYFAPVDNLFLHGIWKDNSIGDSSYFTRTPGYGFVYLLAKLLGGDAAFFLLKIFQLIFFGGSVILFAKILSLLKLPNRWILISTLLFGVLPCFSGFVYYTLSESITPFFVLWSVYAVLKDENSTKLSWNVIFAVTCLLLIRPQLIILPIVCGLFYVRKNKYLTLSITLAFIPFILWNIRSYAIAGEWLGIHPIYSKTNNSLFRPPHKEMTDLFRIWEYRGDHFHNAMALLSRDTTQTTRTEVLADIPTKYHASVEPLLKDFQYFRFDQLHSTNPKASADFFPGEKELVSKIQRAKHTLIAENTWDYYIQTPWMSFKAIITTSMMNLYVFQDPWRNNLLVFGLKIGSFLLIVIGLLSAVLILLIRSETILKVIAVSVLSSLFYLSFIQRFNEERYLTPYLGLLFMLAVWMAFHLFEQRKMNRAHKKRPLN